MLTFNQVSLVYEDGTKAVDDLTVNIPKGQFCVLLGPSGAGKSSLMGMVNGLLAPTSGDIVFNGERFDRINIRNIQQRVGMIHQQLHLVPRLSVLHNVLSGALPRTSNIRSLFKLFTKNMQRKACRLLEEMELEEMHINRRASALSGGQQQRVAIARAFMMDPNVVLADEPVASLDPAISTSVLGLLKKSARLHGAAVLCSLHQVEFALEFADRIIGLRKGKLVYDGTSEDLTDNILDDLYGNRQCEQTNSYLPKQYTASELDTPAHTVQNRRVA